MSGNRPTADQRATVLRQHRRGPVPDSRLDADGELALAATVVDGREAENQLAVLASSTAVPSIGVVAHLKKRVLAGDDARRALITSTRRLVVTIARRHDGDGATSQALVAAGDAALIRAIDRYDPTGGLPFSAFARWWIERAMREVERHPTASGSGASTPAPADPTLLTALGHLNQDDCNVIELRMGLAGDRPLSATDTAQTLGLDLSVEEEREERALAKLRHPSTPGDLSSLRRL